MGVKVSVPNEHVFSSKKPLTHKAFKQNVKNHHEKQRASLPTTNHRTKEDDRQHRCSTGSVDPSVLCFNTAQVGEDDRMNANHFALKVLFEGNMLNSVSHNINFESSATKVLDIGCGAGSWIMDMATEYPNVEFTGIDQVSLFPHDIRPANVSFQKQDVLLGLPFEDNSFDFVQMRLFLFALNRTQWKLAMKEAYRVTKRGGCIQLLECQLIDPGNEIVQEFGVKLRDIMEANDQDPETCDNLPTILQHAGYTPIESLRKAVPLQNHILSTEFMYIIDISIESCRRFISDLFNIGSPQEFALFKSRFMESRRQTSESAWTCAVGKKE